MTIEKPSIESQLRELVKKNGLRRVARDLGIDHASLFRSLMDGSNLKLERVKRLLDYFGYEIKIVKKRRREEHHGSIQKGK
jgi:DNA-binding phage protein